jgi:thioesterase domain-containing protein
MAALYVKEIKRVRPQGPYLLGGYCGGGTIAYEVAQQLQAEGEQVALLAMFDTYNWSKVPRRSIWGRAYHNAQRVMFHAANFLFLDSEGKGKFFWEKAKQVGSRIPVWQGMLLAMFDKHSQIRTATSGSRVLGQIWEANDRAALNYVPKPYPGAVTDFRPKKQYRIFNQPGLKWDHLAGGGQEIVVLPVYPGGMLVEPFVKDLADALRRSIDSTIHHRPSEGHKNAA